MFYNINNIVDEDWKALPVSLPVYPSTSSPMELMILSVEREILKTD